MNNAQQTARVGLFFLLGLALTWVTFETLSDGKVFKDRGYILIAGFESLKELKQGDEVRMAGVKIGSVEQTRLAGSRRAEAVLRIDPKVDIRSDATASIVMAGLIGTNYIGIDLGTPTAAALKDGAEIRTKVTPDINAIMSELGNLGKKLECCQGCGALLLIPPLSAFNRAISHPPVLFSFGALQEASSTGRTS